MVENLHQIYFIMNIRVDDLKEQPCSFYFGNAFNCSQLAVIFAFNYNEITNKKIEKKNNLRLVFFFFSLFQSSYVCTFVWAIAGA